MIFLGITPSHKVRAIEKTLKSFETDYCTMFIDGPIGSSGIWKHCCLEHDLRYWFGGSQEDMDAADFSIKECVTKVAGNSWGNFVYRGIRLGHFSPIKNKYKWGWAWSEKRAISPLTTEESEYVISELKKLNPEELKPINIEAFIKKNFPVLNLSLKN